VPEDRQLGGVANPRERGPDHDRLRAVGLSRARSIGPVDLDDDRDAVALGDRLGEPSATPFRQVRVIVPPAVA